MVSTQNAARDVFIDTTGELYELTAVSKQAAATWDNLFQPDCVTVIVPQSTFQLSARTYTIALDEDCIKAAKVDSHRRPLPFPRMSSVYRLPLEVDDSEGFNHVASARPVRATRAFVKTNRGMALWDRRAVDDDGKAYPYGCPFEVVKNVVREVSCSAIYSSHLTFFRLPLCHSTHSSLAFYHPLATDFVDAGPSGKLQVWYHVACALCKRDLSISQHSSNVDLNIEPRPEKGGPGIGRDANPWARECRPRGPWPSLLQDLPPDTYIVGSSSRERQTRGTPALCRRSDFEINTEASSFPSQGLSHELFGR